MLRLFWCREGLGSFPTWDSWHGLPGTSPVGGKGGNCRACVGGVSIEGLVKPQVLCSSEYIPAQPTQSCPPGE